MTRGDLSVKGEFPALLKKTPRSENSPVPPRCRKSSPILITSRAAAPGTRTGLRDHAQNHDHGRSPRSGRPRCSVIMPGNMITEDRPCPGGCRMARDLGKSSSGGSAARLYAGSRRPPASRSLPGSGTESCRCAEPFPALARRVAAARSLSRLWHGELPLRGAFPGSGTESCRCAERCPHIGRSTLRAARSLRGKDGERSVIMPQATENAP